MRDHNSPADPPPPYTTAVWLLSNLRSKSICRIGNGLGRRDVKAVLHLGPVPHRSAARRISSGAVAVAIDMTHAARRLCRVRDDVVHSYLLRHQIDAGGDLLLTPRGIELIYAAVAHQSDGFATPRTADDIIAQAMTSRCLLSIETIERYCEIVGAAAADVLVGALAFGGVYLTGALSDTLYDFLRRGRFRQTFETRYADALDLRQAPTYVIREREPSYRSRNIRVEADFSHPFHTNWTPLARKTAS